MPDCQVWPPAEGRGLEEEGCPEGVGTAWCEGCGMHASSELEAEKALASTAEWLRPLRGVSRAGVAVDPEPWDELETRCVWQEWPGRRVTKMA